MICRDLRKFAGCPGFRVCALIDAADEPKNGRRVPPGSEATKIFAGGGWLGFLNARGRKFAPERFDNATRGLGIIRDKVIPVERRDLWRPGCTLTPRLPRSQSV